MKYLIVLFVLAAIALASTQGQTQTTSGPKLAPYNFNDDYEERRYHIYPSRNIFRHRRSVDVGSTDQETEEWRHKHFNYYRPAYGYRGHHGYRWKRSAELDTQDLETEEDRRKYYRGYFRTYY